MYSLKCVLMVLGLTFSWSSRSETRIFGQLTISPSCQSDEAMLWLSRSIDDVDTLLLHTMVPDKGTYAFSVKPGSYKIVASTETNCIFEERDFIVSHKSTELNVEVKE